jgi:hypothetical protein
MAESSLASAASAAGFSYVAGIRVTSRSGGGLSPIWCDAARSRAVCFLSRADAAFGRGRPERLIATAQTVALRRALGAPAAHALVPRYGRPFAIGRARLELVPSGSLPGAAQLLIELRGEPGGESWRGLYAGTPSPRPLAGAEPLQARACDELVVDAPEDGGVVDGLEAAIALLDSGASGDRLAPEGLRALFALVEHGRLGRNLGRSLGRNPGRDRLALPARLARAAGLQPRRVAPASAALARRVIAGRRAATDDVLALGLGPTVDELVAFALDCGARRVHVRLHGREPRRIAGARALVAALAARKIDASPLGPPEQLALFPGHGPG